MRFSLFLSLFLATLLSTSHADFGVDNPIRLRRRSGAAVRSDSYKINCQSFRVGVEANNLRDWDTIPSYCKSYIKTYLEKNQYGLDVEAVVATAIDYADTFDINTIANDVWVFDVEETLISNLKYLASSDVQYGTNPMNTTAYYEWLLKTATAVPSMPDLLSTVWDYGFEIVLLSGAPESLKNGLIDALEMVGYPNVQSLGTIILKGEADNGKSMVQFKSDKRKELVKQGFRIVANVGDQWSDLSGENAGIRTFKVPNPVYYIP